MEPMPLVPLSHQHEERKQSEQVTRRTHRHAIAKNNDPAQGQVNGITRAEAKSRNDKSGCGKDDRRKLRPTYHHSPVDYGVTGQPLQIVFDGGKGQTQVTEKLFPLELQKLQRITEVVVVKIKIDDQTKGNQSQERAVPAKFTPAEIPLLVLFENER